MNKKPVSVAVISFNSSSTILETLNSVVNQSYGAENIELIISDDSSKDHTVDLIKSWLKKNESFFKKVELIANPINRGVPKNCNLAWKAATCEWIKTIAGDDILLVNCLELNVNEANKNPDVAVIFSLMDGFFVNDLNDKVIKASYPLRHQQKVLLSPVCKQLKYLRYGDISGAPTAFINNKKLIEINYADERMQLVEDLPMWYNFVRIGYKLHFFPEKTVLYRMDGDSITNSKARLININFINDLIKIDKYIINKDLNHKHAFLKIRKYLWPRCAFFISRVFNNNYSFMAKLMLSTTLLIKPGNISSKLLKLKDKYINE
ncbi:glycosyltransferase family 2 protein [Pectobacterium punjabense]|uniref:glycosyltransferase family 2 protein n=1 Tax=Pectobacterium punjabense TaxID=2108399 RepID=UPI00240640FE|nr:glycosyltransferase family 2 protein [Pectobacterium punjabense]MDG0796881.1 glycosyltransferase family 2 protein [Pectobacterium punjabense]